MKSILFIGMLGILMLGTSGTVMAEEGAQIEFFSPQATVKYVKQVAVRFSQQMVPFGDPRAIIEPFNITCPEKGTQRWADQKNWIYDFDRDLPAGIRCEFTLKSEVKALSGTEIIGQKKFIFSTGGPAIIRFTPYEGSAVDEEQIFILELDAEPSEESLLSHVAFSVEGIHEPVGFRILSDKEMKPLIESHYQYRKWFVKISDQKILSIRTEFKKEFKKDLLVIQAKQRFPSGAKVSIIWGKGVAAKSGVETEEDQKLHFRVREPFTANFHCQRENPEADCIPISSMHLSFSAPVSWSQAKKIVLRSSDGKAWTAEPSGRYSEYGEGSEDEGDEQVGKKKFVYSIVFKAPFPQKTEFKVELPSVLEDDAGRKLSNADKFPVTSRTDEYPPLAKFPSRFGILELNAEPALPVTLRNVEPHVMAKMHSLDDKTGEKNVLESLKGKIFKIKPMQTSNKADEIYSWLKRLSNYNEYDDRLQSIFSGQDYASKIKNFSIPKPNGAKAFEVVGIPMKEPGFYVVEIESAILGASLLGKSQPMYVPTSVLVTNLSVHFKWGRESSLAWVTTLDKALPVKDATVQVRDCKGNIHYQGWTDANGIARILTLPAEKDVPQCSYNLDRGLFVTAELKDDFTFVHSNWKDGIEPWRFQLPYASFGGPVIAHTILDRSLLRAGETLHMKHVIRNHTMQGFSQVKEDKLPKSIIISHYGSGQQYEFPLLWDKSGVAETVWEIPKEARLGEYDVSLSLKDLEKNKDIVAGDAKRFEDRYFEVWQAGNFRVEEFRVPLMKGIIQPPSQDLVLPKDVQLDLAVLYLAGGGAGNMPIKLRSQLKSGLAKSFHGYEDFAFNAGAVKEGVLRRGEYRNGEEVVPQQKIETMELKLDPAGTARVSIKDMPHITQPMSLMTELEFKDPNGEVQTVSSRIPIYNSRWSVGIKPDSWALSKDAFKFHVAVVDLSGKPVSDAPINVDLIERKYYSHRKRLVGGFYAYEHVTEVKRLDTICTGKTDNKGLLICEAKSSVSGNVILQAKTIDELGNEIATHSDVWVAGKDEWWFDVSDGDRIDIIPEKKQYESGEIAKFQVRMPFREATALITVEREGVIKPIVKKLSGKMPVIEIPVEGRFAPNIFVSVLAVKGRSGGVQPTATIDLGRPAYKLGIAEIQVGWKEHELKVKVSSDKKVYRIRDKSKIKIEVTSPDKKALPHGAEIALAAVDEGLLELMPNDSWEILRAMMGQRGYEVSTSTAQMNVIGKRHFGLKALPQGGGGGKQTTRELFDTLLVWMGRVKLNEKGEAEVQIPLNDSVTSFRIVAVAQAGVDLFGTGSTSIRSIQELTILSGIAPLVREGDRFKSEFTLRNSTEKKMNIDVSAKVIETKQDLKPLSITLSPGEAKEIYYDISVPVSLETLTYEIEAREKEGLGDKIIVKQKVIPAVPVRTFHATITQVEKDYKVIVEQPHDAIHGRGGVNVNLQTTLTNSLEGAREFMRFYTYNCLEQMISKAITLRDKDKWKQIMAGLPNYLDGDGLANYFPSMIRGSDVLTAYILSISNEAGWDIPENSRDKMLDGLTRFIEGKIILGSSLPTADLSIRKIAAVEALSRYRKVNAQILSSIAIEPNLWPTSAVIDWFNILKRVNTVTDREKRFKEANQILRSRLNFQGTIMGFSTEAADNLWWLMVTNDVNAVRFLLSVLDEEMWTEDIARIVRGALARQYKGAWNITVANAWGILSIEKFSSLFEKEPVTGITSVTLARNMQRHDWKDLKNGSLLFSWPIQKDVLSINHQGTGKPWATIQSLAAIPLKEPLSSGYKIKKSYIPVEQKKSGDWSKGDIMRVRLEIEAQADMTWVVVSDPIPAGGTILGGGMGRDSQFASVGEKNTGWVWPAFEERSFEAFRSYYEYVPKGSFVVEYTVRLNQSGIFEQPTTRVEALYAPEMFGEIPNKQFSVE